MTIQRLTLSALCLFMALPFSLAVHAQTPDASAKETTKKDVLELPSSRLLAARAKTSDCSTFPTRTERYDCTEANSQTRMVYLTNVTGQNEVNEILVAVRNMFDPSLKVYMLASQNVIVLSSYPKELNTIEAFIHDLDKPHKLYRLTYTIATTENGKNIGTQHYSLVASEGQRTLLKEGDKVPVATGSYSTEKAAAQTQFTYLDVGMNFDATPVAIAGGVSLKTKVEQSSIGPTNTIAGVAEPVVRQSVLEGVSVAQLGKPLMLGSIDIPNSTRHLDIDVLVEQIK